MNKKKMWLYVKDISSLIWCLGWTLFYFQTSFNQILMLLTIGGGMLGSPLNHFFYFSIIFSIPFTLYLIWGNHRSGNYLKVYTYTFIPPILLGIFYLINPPEARYLFSF